MACDLLPLFCDFDESFDDEDEEAAALPAADEGAGAALLSGMALPPDLAYSLAYQRMVSSLGGQGLRPQLRAQ